MYKQCLLVTPKLKSGLLIVCKKSSKDIKRIYKNSLVKFMDCLLKSLSSHWNI